MPPRIANARDAGTGFKAFWESLPPVTRNLTTAILVLSVSCDLVLSPRWVLIWWPMVLKKFEVWRLVTTFFFIPLGMRFIYLLIWLVQYGGPVERTSFEFDPAGYLFMLLFNSLLLLALSPFIGPILGVPLIVSIVYVWSKQFHDQNVSLYGLVTIKAFWVPFAFMAIDYLMKQGLVPWLAGIAVGHVYYFLHDLYPLQTGRTPLATPAWLKSWCADYGLGAPPPNDPRVAAGAPQGFRAFAGRGQRLGQHED